MRKLRAFARPSALAAIVALGAGAGVVSFIPSPPATVSAYGTVVADLPAKIGDAEFWRMVTDFSEPGGYFRSDNLVSNELTFQHVIPELVQMHGSGGIYLGVGPDQNFTYVVALRPKIAFIVDIRRGNLQQHLLYKALIEMAPTRADFLSLLFSRPRPTGLAADTRVQALFAAYDSVAPDSALFARTFDAVRRKLVDEHRFPLTSSDLEGIDYILRAFLESGPQLTYSFGTGNRGFYGGWRGMPTYAELMVQTDGDGVERGYLASEENFHFLRQLESNNLVVPLVGDFGGDKAIKAVGAWLKERGAVVSAVYTSNVEQYLFQNEESWRRYYTNVATLPLDRRSTFVRAVFNYGGWRDPSSGRGPRSVTMLSPITDLLDAVNRGQVQSYWDVIQMSRAPVGER